MTDSLEDLAAIQSSLDRVEKWTEKNLMRLNNGKYLVLHLGRNNPIHQYSLGGWLTGKQPGREGP